MSNHRQLWPRLKLSPFFRIFNLPFIAKLLDEKINPEEISGKTFTVRGIDQTQFLQVYLKTKNLSGWKIKTDFENLYIRSQLEYICEYISYRRIDIIYKLEVK